MTKKGESYVVCACTVVRGVCSVNIHTGEETGASTATISRVNRTMSKGSKLVLERLKNV